MIRKNISIDETSLQKLQPFLEKNKGNLSAAIREIIDIANSDFENPEHYKKYVESPQGRDKAETREQLIRTGEYMLISQQLLKWLVKSSAGRLIDEDVVHGLINPYTITTLSKLEEYLNDCSNRMGWKLEISYACNKGMENKSTIMNFTGGDHDFREILVTIVCIFLSRWMDLDVEALHKKSNSIAVYLKNFVRHDPSLVSPGVKKYFGSKDLLFREIDNKPEFWITLAELNSRSNYQRVNLDRDFFEALVAGEIPNLTKYFETKADRSIHEIPLSELLPLFKCLIVSSQLADNVEICARKGKEHIKIWHTYSDEKVVLKLIKLLSNVFDAGWHKFSVRSVSELLIFDFSTPEILEGEIKEVSFDEEF